MTTRRIRSGQAAAAAEIVRQVRDRPLDLIDPFPPASEAEVLADMAARGKDEALHAHIAVEGEAVVGYGALDFSPELRRADLVGPVVHPAHRRKGHGRRLLNDLLDQGRAARQRQVRILVGSDNAAARALLRDTGFKRRERHTCLRLARPARLPDFMLDDIRIERVTPESAEAYFEFTRKSVARQPSQARSLLKSDDYVAVLAVKSGAPVGCVEVDLRYGKVASVENLDAPPSLLHRGLGNALLAEAIRIAFENERIQALDLLMEGTDRARLEGLLRAGFELRHELEAFELKL